MGRDKRPTSPTPTVTTIGISAESVTAHNLTINQWATGQSRPLGPSKKRRSEGLLLGVTDPEFIEVLCRRDFLNKIHRDLGFGKTEDSEDPGKLANALALVPQERVTVLSRVRIISGLSGAGKTEVVRQYIFLHAGKTFHNVVWLDARSTDVCRDSFLQRAEQLPLLPKNGVTDLSKPRSTREGQCQANDPEAGKQNQNQNLYQLIQQFYKKLCRYATLLVFDDASRLESDLFDLFLPACWPNVPGFKPPSILVTTQCSDWTSTRLENCNVLLLPVLTSDEAATFLIQELGLNKENKEVKTKVKGHKNSDDLNSAGLDAALSLARLLGGLPLAIAQAVAYIRKEREASQFLTRGQGHDLSPIEDYIQLFKDADHKRKFLPPIRNSGRSNPNTLAVHSTLTLTLDKISREEEGTEAIKVMQTLAFLSSTQLPVKYLLFLLTSEDPVSEESSEATRIGGALVLLKNYLIISKHEEVGPERAPPDQVPGPGAVTSVSCISVHSLVQQIVLDNLHNETEKSSSLSAELLEKIMERTVRFFKGLSSSPNDVTLRPTLSSTLTLLDHLQHKMGDKMKVEKILRFQKAAGLKFKDIGNDDQAWKILSASYTLKSKLDTSEFRLAIADCAHNMASLLLRQGQNSSKLQEGLRLYEEATAVRRDLLGLTHPDTLNGEMNTGLIFHKLGQYDKALEVYHRVLPLQIETLGSSHTDTLTTVRNIGSTYQRMGRTADAIKVHQEVLDKLGGLTLGEKEPSNITQERARYKTLHKLAFSLKNAGCLEDSRKLNEMVLEGRRKLLGPHHPDTLITENNLAGVLRLQGHLHLALDMYKSVHRNLENVQGSDHNHTLKALSHVGQVCKELGQYTEATEAFTKVLEKWRETLGPFHPNTVDVLIISRCSSRDHVERLKARRTWIIKKRKKRRRGKGLKRLGQNARKFWGKKPLKPNRIKFKKLFMKQFMEV